ncbi:hypothetical protein WJX72_004038 [[Myrmecia] bisecta]|uniref:Uncharacterized protein n=1 Tax=[Myrmecia] bisecta TaxID=41462 RepID=A0AAW1R735_9CHLO
MPQRLEQLPAAQRQSCSSVGPPEASTSNSPAPQGPLAGFKVLDLGQVVAGNFCGAILAYFGADVIKVEPPGRGDALRSLRATDSTGTSLWWRSYGRNRRCMTVDLHKEEGRELVRALAAKVDVLVENFRPGVMEKWQLGPQDLPAHLVYTRISGYGQTGPKASLPGYASVCEAYGGFRHLNGYLDRPPVRPNISLGDSLAGLHAAFGAVMALLHRQRATSGNQAGGQVVDAAISESMFNMLDSCVSEYAMQGYDRPASGSTISGIVPSATMKTRDGKYVIIGGNGESIYTRLMAAVGRPDMGADNPKYANNTKRCEHEAEIYEVLEGWVAQHSLPEVVEAMKAARVPCGPILSTGDIYHEEQYRQRDMFHTATTPSGSEPIVMSAIVPKLSATPGATRWAGPDLGEHMEEILREELQLSEARIAELRGMGAI